MPVLIKEIKTGQINKYFYVQKILETCLILWENAQCVCAKSHIFSPKALFSIQFFGVMRSDYKTVLSSFSSHVSALILAKSFIKFKQVVFAHTLDNQRGLKSLFSVSSYIVLRLDRHNIKYLKTLQGDFKGT